MNAYIQQIKDGTSQLSAKIIKGYNVGTDFNMEQKQQYHSISSQSHT